MIVLLGSGARGLGRELVGMRSIGRTPGTVQRVDTYSPACRQVVQKRQYVAFNMSGCVQACGMWTML
jgi:hypothetical protein